PHRVRASASHLPQLAATALMGAVAQVESPAALRRLVASGFRDTTRVAASDPDLWVDICATNGPSIVAALDVLTSRLEVLRKLVAEGDRAGLREELAAARAARLRIPTKPGSSPRGLREVVVHVADRPGSLAAVFHALGAAGVNVEDLAIDTSCRAAAAPCASGSLGVTPSPSPSTPSRSPAGPRMRAPAPPDPTGFVASWRNLLSNLST